MTSSEITLYIIISVFVFLLLGPALVYNRLSFLWKVRLHRAKEHAKLYARRIYAFSSRHLGRIASAASTLVWFVCVRGPLACYSYSCAFARLCVRILASGFSRLAAVPAVCARVRAKVAVQCARVTTNPQFVWLCTWTMWLLRVMWILIYTPFAAISTGPFGYIASVVARKISTDNTGPEQPPSATSEQPGASSDPTISQEEDPALITACILVVACLLVGGAVFCTVKPTDAYVATMQTPLQQFATTPLSLLVRTAKEIADAAAMLAPVIRPMKWVISRVLGRELAGSPFFGVDPNADPSVYFEVVAPGPDPVLTGLFVPSTEPFTGQQLAFVAPWMSTPVILLAILLPGPALFGLWLKVCSLGFQAHAYTAFIYLPVFIGVVTETGISTWALDAMLGIYYGPALWKESHPNHAKGRLRLECVEDATWLVRALTRYLGLCAYVIGHPHLSVIKAAWEYTVDTYTQTTATFLLVDGAGAALGLAALALGCLITVVAAPQIALAAWALYRLPRSGVFLCPVVFSVVMLVARLAVERALVVVRLVPEQGTIVAAMFNTYFCLGGVIASLCMFYLAMRLCIVKRHA